MLSVEKVKIISAGNCDAVAISVCLIESLAHAFIVIEVKSSVVHEFNSASLKDWATLRSGVHQSHLMCASCVSDGDGRRNWEIVSGYIIKDL